MQKAKIKVPHIRILFALYFAEKGLDIAISKIVKVCGINKVNYVDELYNMGFVKLYHRVNVKKITACVALSRSGSDFMTEVFDMLTKHKLWDYIRILPHNGLIVLDNESTRLVYALSLLVLRSRTEEPSELSTGCRS